MWSRLTVWTASLQDAATMCFVGKLQHVSGVNLQLVDLTKFTSATTFWLYETRPDLELLRTAPKLSSLRVTGAGVTCAFVRSLVEYPFLTDLTLAHCHSVTNEALASLATLKLKRLDLTGVAVGDAGVGPLLSDRLESLSVCSTSVTCDLLTRLPLSLKELKCSAANERVLEHIGKLVNLSFLEIFPVTDSGLAHLATCVNLSDLNLSACPITSFAQFGALPKLQKLDVRNTQLPLEELVRWAKTHRPIGSENLELTVTLSRWSKVATASEFYSYTVLHSRKITCVPNF